MKKNSGFTLLEVLIAMLLLILVLFTGSGIYLSGMNLSMDAQSFAEAHRNAQTVMMHIQKNTIEAATKFCISSEEVIFTVYDNPPDFSSPTSIKKIYRFNNSDGTITFTQTRAPAIVFRHIKNCAFSSAGDGVILDVILEAYDNRHRNFCRLTTSIAGRFTTYPS